MGTEDRGDYSKDKQTSDSGQDSDTVGGTQTS